MTRSDLSEAVPRLDVTGLSKRFAATKALDGVSMTVMPGEIHALVGQNGSGKSTFVKVMSGYHRPDAGRVVLDGVPLTFPLDPRRVRAAGLSCVHQDLGLIDNLTVAENIRITDFHLRRGHIDWKAEAKAAEAALFRLGVDLPVTRTVRTLGPAARAIVAIARAIQTQKPGGGLLFLDEATRALPKHSVSELHGVVRSLASAGGAVLMVTHDLREVLELADRVTVLRSGQAVVEAAPTKGLRESDLARMMLGQDLVVRTVQPSSRTAASESRITIRGLETERLRDLDMELGDKEIVGVTGLAGSGYEDLPYALSGATPVTAGRIAIGGRPLELPGRSSGEMLRHGVALVPEKRIEEGLALALSIKDNLTVPRVRRVGRRWFIGEEWQTSETVAMIERFGIVPPDPDVPVAHLSGGNQQKVLLAKWLSCNPSLLVLHEPTQGVDVAARQAILETLQGAAAQGCSILISSGEADDLAEICDRVLVIAAGRVDRELEGEIEPDDILDAIYQATFDEELEKESVN